MNINRRCFSWLPWPCRRIRPIIRLRHRYMRRGRCCRRRYCMLPRRVSRSGRTRVHMCFVSLSLSLSLALSPLPDEEQTRTTYLDSPHSFAYDTWTPLCESGRRGRWYVSVTSVYWLAYAQSIADRCTSSRTPCTHCSARTASNT